MKRRFTIMIAAAVLLGGCHKEVRQVFSAHAATSDSTQTATKDTVTVARLDVGGYKVTEQTEEQEAVPGSEVSVVVPLRDTDLNAANGRANMHVRVQDGRATITCKADSLLRVVKRMRYDSAWQAKRQDSLAAKLMAVAQYKTDSVATKVATKERKSGGASWLWVVGFVVVAFVAGWKGPSWIKLIRLI